MKPIVQVPLTILVVAVLIFIMYSQSKKSEEDEKSASDPVQSHETSREETAEQDMPEDEVVEEDEEIAEAAALDAMINDQPDTEESPQTPPKKVAKDQAERATASLRERRRNMFKKIDTGEKDDIVSKEEHDRFFRKAFQFYDKNDDGRLTGKELRQVKRLPPKADVNKDGILTRKEFLDQFERFFVIMDKDESGDLSEKEFVR